MAERHKRTTFAVRDENTCIQLLEAHGIKPTSNRILVVRALATEDAPSSISDLERRLLSVDKSSIFRCLMVFREHHLVHSLEDGDGQVKYELCHRHGDSDDDLHVHFYCRLCHRIFCMEDTPVPLVAIPEGFRMESVNYMIKGLCPECARKRGQRL